jgi:hypothetical protein
MICGSLSGNCIWSRVSSKEKKRKKQNIKVNFFLRQAPWLLLKFTSQHQHATIPGWSLYFKQITLVYSLILSMLRCHMALSISISIIYIHLFTNTFSLTRLLLYLKQCLDNKNTKMKSYPFCTKWLEMRYTIKLL